MRPGGDNDIIVRAKVLLRETDKPVRDIALRLLFDSTETFINYFRKRVGVTPLQYRGGAVPMLHNPGKPWVTATRIAVDFPNPIVRERTIWLPESYVAATEDIMGITVTYAEIERVNGDILRVKKFDRVPHKSAMQRIDVVGIARRNNRRTTMQLVLTQQSSELTVSVDGTFPIARITADLVFTTQGPR